MYFTAAGRILQAFRGETLPIGVDFVWPFGAASTALRDALLARTELGTGPNWGQAQSDLTANQPKPFMPVPFFRLFLRSARQGEGDPGSLQFDAAAQHAGFAGMRNRSSCIRSR